MRIAVYLGSSDGRRPEYAAAAGQTGVLMAQAGLSIVYGGSSIGLMGTLADAALAAGGEVTGVIPAGLFAAEVAHQGLSRLEVVGTMHERKARMAELADGFAVLPGGLGTLEELLEVVTWHQLHLHTKPVVLLDVGGFWHGLLGFVDGLVADGFVPAATREYVMLAATPADLVSKLCFCLS